MIDLACVFTTGGVLLFQITFCQLKFDIVDMLIKQKLLKERQGDSSFHQDPYMIKWTLANEFDLIFCIVYQELFQLQFIEDLLEIFKAPVLKNEKLEIPDFKQNFSLSYEQWQVIYLNQEYIKTKIKSDKQMRSFTQTTKGKNLIDKKEPEDVKKSPEKRLSTKEILKSKFSTKKSSSEDTNEIKNVKTQRFWGISTDISSKTMQSLDVNNSSKQQKQADSQYFDTTESDQKILQQFDENVERTSSLFSKLTAKFQTYTGNKTITSEDLDSILETLSNQLISKNVAQTICESLLNSLRTTLLQRKTALFTSLQSTIKEKLTESLTKILSNPYNLLTTILASPKPFVITFIGVNGVGKSTTLSKIAYLLQQNNLQVLIAACDNFRAGAIEQLEQHARNLNIPLFEKGYKQDPAIIAQQAIAQAKQQKKDVVLIDTAGRMQDNEPLMKALARLVQINKPDLVVFIGEAIAGCDSVDQLTKFDKALLELGGRGIDAMVLSKFDTVDDKIGQAINLTYTTGKPILYVGVGQKYPHLRKLNARIAVNSLLA